MHGSGLELALVFLLAAVIAVPVFKRFGLGAVLAYLVAGVVLGPDGRVDVTRLRTNLASGGEAVARALTLEALDAIVSYALFTARNVLPPDVAERLSNTYRTLQGGLA